MAVVSAGILMYRIHQGSLEVLLLHPGGPFFKNKDEGVWSIPKGIPNKGEEPEQTAVREFHEETGLEVKGKLLSLGFIKQKGGKVVHAWAVEGNIPKSFTLKSNFFELEWPPRSGNIQQFPEMDKGEFLPVKSAKTKINPAQVLLIERLEEALANQNFH